ncbi:MAG: polysaccharide biosynthesis/export family protein [Rhizobiaceae bacterium]|nr:polysaccharide biosynthesis/export family protein [Rhizobiaceae bacterium]
MAIKGSIFKSFRTGKMAATALAVGLACSFGTVFADAAELVPQTRFRLKIVQWMPVKSAYEQWDALGGEFVVSSGGSVSLPVVGPITVSGIDSEALATEIADRLQKKTGLVSKPEVTIEIISYPPIYVTGNIAKPGEFPYREGITVTQAVALSGGPRHQLEDADSIKLLSEIKSKNDEILLATARIARLDAELNGADHIEFPDAGKAGMSEAAAGVFERERILFEVRMEELDRQTKSLKELRDLFTAEIGVLEQKRSANEQAVKNAEKELAGVATLVDKGFAVAGRKSEMERVVAGMRSDTLDQTTAIMRARQGIAEATRNIDSMQDRRRSDAAAELQDWKANLERAQTERDVAQRLLFQMLGNAPVPGQSLDETVAYLITREVDGKQSSVDATGSTMLRPGDVLNVTQVIKAGQQASATPATDKGTPAPKKQAKAQGNVSQ